MSKKRRRKQVDEADRQDSAPSGGRLERIVLAARWYVLTAVLMLASFLYGGYLERKIAGQEELSLLERAGQQISGATQDALKVIDDPAVLQSADIQPETRLADVAALSPQRIYRIGVDKVPVDKSFLYSRFDAAKHEVTVTLRKLDTNQIQHEWRFSEEKLAELWEQFGKQKCPHFLKQNVAQRPALGCRTPTLLPDGNLVVDLYCQLCCFDREGSFVWSIDRLSHHSVEVDHEGNLWTSGRAENGMGEWDEDTVLKLDSKTGEVLFEKPLTEIFSTNPPANLSHHNRYNSDPYHLNDVQPVLSDSDSWRTGDLFLSIRNLNAVVLYRPSENRILWWNAVHWSSQHDVEILDGQSITVFDNNVIPKPGSTQTFYPRFGPFLRCLRFDLTTGELNDLFADVLGEYRCASPTEGRFKLFLEDQLAYVEVNHHDFFLVIDLAAQQAFKCVIPGNSEDRVGKLAWFRLVD